MSKFTDLLNRPLPSQGDAENMFESENEDMEMAVPEPEDLEDKVKQEDGDDDDDDDDNDELNDLASTALSDAEDDAEGDISDLSDEELAELDRELGGSLDDSGDDEAVVLTPEEEKEADDMMSIAATTVLINNEMNAEEKAKFLESQLDTTIAINEGLLLESDINEMAMECGLMTEANNYNKKMIIRLDKEARMKQLYALAINVCAAAHADPDYAKLKKLTKMRKIIRTKLQKKYHGEAVKRAKVYMKRLMSSKSKPLSELGKKIQK